jgi:hypothetical protein
MRCRSVGSRISSFVAGSLLVVGVATPVVAQDAAPQAPAAASDDSTVLSFFKSTEVSGFVDMYYGYNFNKPQTPCNTIGEVKIFNCLRNFDVTHNSFSLNLAEVALEKKPTDMSRGGFRVDLNYGPTAAIVHGFEPGGTTIFQNIEQAYISYLAPTGKGLQVDLGKFVTMMGNEVIETKDNWNYSRSLLFALAIPYYHMGARVTYSPSDKLTLQGHLVNGWNNVTDNNTGKSIGGSITYKPTGALTLIENYMTGPEQNNTNTGWRNTSDTVVTYTANKQTSLAFNYDYGHDAGAACAAQAGTICSVAWQGLAAYLKYQANPVFAVIPRYEWYKDGDGYTTGLHQTVQEFTLTAEVKHKDGVLMRIEYRGDYSDSPFFIKEANTGLVKTQNTLSIGFVYAFSTKSP